jgi:hypothetical protein
MLLQLNQMFEHGSESDGLYHDGGMAQSEEYDLDETRDDQNKPT